MKCGLTDHEYRMIKKDVLEDARKIMGQDAAIIDKLIQQSQIVDKDQFGETVASKVLLSKFGVITEALKDNELSEEQYAKEMTIACQQIRNSIGAMQDEGFFDGRQLRDIFKNYYEEQRDVGDFAWISEGTATNRLANFNLKNFANQMAGNTNFVKEFKSSNAGSYSDWSLNNEWDLTVGRSKNFAGANADDVIAKDRGAGLAVAKTDGVVQLSAAVNRANAKQNEQLQAINENLEKMVTLQGANNDLSQDLLDENRQRRDFGTERPDAY